MLPLPQRCPPPQLPKLHSEGLEGASGLVAELVAEETCLVLKNGQIFTLSPDAHLRIGQFITGVRYRRIDFF